MVIFGAPMAHEQDTRRAVLTALAFRQGLNRLKVSSQIADFYLSHRMGIHTGIAFAGNIGSEEQNRQEFTVMGDTVNLGARLEGANKNYGTDILVCHHCDRIIDGRIFIY